MTVKEFFEKMIADIDRRLDGQWNSKREIAEMKAAKQNLEHRIYRLTAPERRL